MNLFGRTSDWQLAYNHTVVFSSEDLVTFPKTSQFSEFIIDSYKGGLDTDKYGGSIIVVEAQGVFLEGHVDLYEAIDADSGVIRKAISIINTAQLNQDLFSSDYKSAFKFWPTLTTQATHPYSNHSFRVMLSYTMISPKVLRINIKFQEIIIEFGEPTTNYMAGGTYLTTARVVLGSAATFNDPSNILSSKAGGSFVSTLRAGGAKLSFPVSADTTLPVGKRYKLSMTYTCTFYNGLVTPETAPICVVTQRSTPLSMGQNENLTTDQNILAWSRYVYTAYPLERTMNIFFERHPNAGNDLEIFLVWPDNGVMTNLLPEYVLTYSAFSCKDLVY